MSDWWEQPYKGGPMVAVKGFARPLYPPDAAPAYQPSTDGPDVEAYKRTIARAGRWPWRPYDQAYSNGFAHGTGGNVIDTGVAGVQRQQNIQPTGFIGRETFNLLRSIRIPDGLPHAGEAAMDARSVELINAAWNLYGGTEPAPTGSSSSAQARLRKAVGEVGMTESPAGSNQQKYGHWYGGGMNGQPWCAIFCTWCDQLSDVPSASFLRGLAYAYVPYIVDEGRLGLNGLSFTSDPGPGDLVCFDWGSDGEYDHVGIVETPPDQAGAFGTIEGNTSTSDNSNGGQVMRRTRNRNVQPTVFVRVAEP